MTLQEFLDILPQVDQAKHPIQAAAGTWASYRAEPNPRFVAPPLRDDEAITPGGTSVVILSAPGAVGKSTTGQEIALRKGAPFVDLASRRVGSDGAAGLIFNLFGPNGVQSAFEELRAGGLFLVVDSLDETRLGSGEANFYAFLQDLAAQFSQPAQMPAALLLARTDTADWIQLCLEEFGLRVARYAIDFFDDQAARAFVKSYVNDPTVTSSVAFNQALDGLLNGVRTAVGDPAGQENLARSVIGYAPVLEAVSRYLLDEENRRNYYRLLQALQREAREWELLLRVAEALLTREQEKVSEQAKLKLQNLTGDWSHWEGLYQPDEQVLRLLARRFGLANPVLPPDLPAILRDGYETLVGQALTDHPFLGSVDGLHPVFGEYLYARMLGDPHGPISTADARGREVLRSGNYLPTRALGRFVHALTSRRGPPAVRPGDLGFVYESLLSDQERPGDVAFTLRTGKPLGENYASIHVAGTPLNFVVTGSQDPIWFWRRLTHASLSVESEVQLGLAGGEFRLGPAVDVECRTLSCPGELRVFGADSEDEEVALIAESFEPMGRSPVIRGTRFYVRGGTVPWPWSAHRGDEPSSPGATQAVIDAYNHLARILLWFRAQGHEGIGRVDDLVEVAAAGATLIARQLVDYCAMRGLIERQDKLYMLRGDVIASYGINYTDLKRRTLRQPVIELLSAFLSQRDRQ